MGRSNTVALGLGWPDPSPRENLSYLDGNIHIFCVKQIQGCYVIVEVNFNFLHGDGWVDGPSCNIFMVYLFIFVTVFAYGWLAPAVYRIVVSV